MAKKAENRFSDMLVGASVSTPITAIASALAGGSKQAGKFKKLIDDYHTTNKVPRTAANRALAKKLTRKQFAIGAAVGGLTGAAGMEIFKRLHTKDIGNRKRRGKLKKYEREALKK